MILILEPYYGGSHRALVDGMVRHLEAPFELWTLPPRKWKWRMRGAAPVFAERWRAERPRPRAVFTSSLLNVAELRGLLPAGARDLPMILYFHENQLNYPVRVEDKLDYHYGWINVLSALSADLLLWNSRYNLDSFLEALPGFVGAMPDHRPRGLADRIRLKSRVLPVPLELDGLVPPRRGERPRILWNHRWEHDKGPEEFFRAMGDLESAGLDFELAVLGQGFRDRPAVFDRARERLAARIVAWGYRETREEYWRELSRAHVAVSTALHEFQGMALLEAAAVGARPLAPRDLAYPEIWPDRFLYERGKLSEALAVLLESPGGTGTDEEACAIAGSYAWRRRAADWNRMLREFA